MAQNLTTTYIERLAVRDVPFEVRDAKFPGLLLRVEPGGTKTFYCELARGKREKIGRTSQLGLHAAREAAGILFARTRMGEDVGESRRRERRAPTLEEFIDGDYTAYAHGKQQDPQGSINRLKTAFADFAARRLTAITRLDIERWRASRRKQGRSNATINRDINCLRAALNQAVACRIIDTNPIAGIAMVAVDPVARVRFLSVAEEQRLRTALSTRNARKRAQRASGNLWRTGRGYTPRAEIADDELPDYLEPLVLLAMNTGLRRGELFNLVWQDIDLQRADLTVAAPGAKSRKVRHVPLNREALQILTNWRASSSEPRLVFCAIPGTPLTTVKTAWLALLKQAGVTDFRFHDLRHHFASRLVMEGVSLATVRELLGHADYAMTLRYAHLERKQRKDAVDLLSRARDQGSLAL